tara:strand:+ start:12613 stop:13365 length:753 start_codon:yes stop_codon:yes gene_type:complete
MTLMPKIGWNETYRNLGALYSLDDRLNSRDRIITPRDSLQSALLDSSVGGSNPDGVRLYLAPGKYFIRGASPLTIAKDRINVIAAVPGQTFLVREAEDPSVAMIKVTGAECSLRGLVIEDNVSASGTSRTSSGIEIAADKVVVEDCYVYTAYFGIKAKDCNWPVIRNNRIRSTAGGYPIHLEGTGAYAQVTNNRIEDASFSSPNATIYADDNWQKSSFVGNVTASSDVISYKTGLNNVNAGNVGTVTVRP